ncbi:MAG: UvrD-helicase domain-containing protein [Candidatus Acidiferrales bacterium]
MPEATTNPAEEAAEAALQLVLSCIRENKSFLVEAGAGAGKTHSLISALKYLITDQGPGRIRRHQKVACLTYTNAAKDEIQSRTDRHPLIYCDTIHAFCWATIKDNQSQLAKELPRLDPWPEKLLESGGIGGRRIEYSLGHRRVTEELVSIHHSDVLALFVALMKFEKFRALLASRFPVLLIDEYQDTDISIAEALKTYFLGKDKSPLIGFFGDHWQMIYRGVCGRIEHPALEVIKKEANFRSVGAVVDALNKMRPELIQHIVDPLAEGSAAVYHSNDWHGQRRTEPHWKDDLPATAAHNYLKALVEQLSSQGWDFSSQKTKILMLTHNVLAEEQGYRSLAAAFPYHDSFINKEDPHIKFFVDTLEPACTAFENKRYGEMFAAFGGKNPGLHSHAEKLQWINDMEGLLEIRNKGSVGEVVDYLEQTQHLSIPDPVERRERELSRLGPEPAFEDAPSLESLHKLRAVPYREVVVLKHFLDDKTPFSTKHGVKGLEFENVLVVLGRGWNLYNFNQMLEWAPDKFPPDRRDTFERNRNLFYVACSRPKTRLALLFTQKLSDKALVTLGSWFGKGAVHSSMSS